MPLIKCDDCEAMISSAAAFCPHCGRPINRPRANSHVDAQRKVGTPLFIGILLFPYIFSFFTLRTGYSGIARFLAFGWLAILVIASIAPTIENESETSVDIETSTQQLPLVKSDYSSMSLGDMLKAAEPVSYEQLARYPEKYKGEAIQVVVKVQQALDERSFLAQMTKQGASWGDTIYVEIKGKAPEGRILVSDVLYLLCEGLVSILTGLLDSEC